VAGMNVQIGFQERCELKVAGGEVRWRVIQA
jgi:hypothetical protein